MFIIQAVAKIEVNLEDHAINDPVPRFSALHVSRP